ncbi:MAG: phosphodiesterase [Chromatiales bacterium]
MQPEAFIERAGAQSEPLRLIQLSDTHYSTNPDAELDGVNPRHSLAQVVRHLKQQERRIDAVLATGDLSHDGTEDSYAALRATFEQLGAPVYCIPGNHDSPAAMSRALTGPRVHVTESLKLGVWHVVFLNTHVPDWEAGRLGEDRLRRFDIMMSGEPDAPTLVCLHHPPLPIGSPWMDAMGVTDAADFLVVVDKHPQVRAVVWGHIHQEFEQRRNGVWFWAVPSTCVQFKPAATQYQRDDLPPGYRRLELLPDGKLSTAVIRLPGNLQ